MGRPGVALATALACVVAGCGTDERAGDDRALAVVATTTEVADFARQVGGPRVRVHQIQRPNADPHGFEPRPSDARAVEEADVVLRSGGDVDEWLGDLASGGTDPVALVDSVRRSGDDPHWWHDPRNVVRAVGAIHDAFGHADPGGRATYERNAEAYVGHLRRLDREVARCIARIPPRDRRLVTTHEALGYYARRYGLEVIGAVIPSRSSEAQASSKDLEALVRQIEEQQVKAIFPEHSLATKLERAISRESGAKVGGALWADTLGPKGSSGESYLDAISSNTEEIVSGLTGGRVTCRPSP